jgi:LPS-assembly protein
MKKIAEILFFCFLSLLLVEQSDAQRISINKKNSSKKSKASKSQSKKDKPIEVSADQVKQDTAKNMIYATGKVIVRYGEKAIRADKVKINTETGQGEAVGHVLMIDVGSRLRAERAKFNLKEKTGKIYNATGEIIKDYRVKGKEIMKVSDNRFKLTESSLTTCKGDLPAWMFEVDYLDIILGDRAIFKGATFKIKDIPLLYLPVGFFPMDNARKSGFLVPDAGSSNLDGFFINNDYFWAINEHSDATISLDYMEKRGVRPSFEYRYTPSKTTAGEFRGEFLDDRSTGNRFWKFDMTHTQELPLGFKLDAKLDLIGDDNFNKTFTNDTNQRTRRSTDSFSLITKSWSNSTLDILTRLRRSTQDSVDDTFGLLPKVTHKVQRTKLGGTGLYFNQDTSYTGFLTDLNPSITNDQDEKIHRGDIHPQVSFPFRPANWLSVTPQVGARFTYYSKGFNSSNTEFSSFSRELFDINTVVEGPKINKVFGRNSQNGTKFNHILEPRFVYDYIPDIDGDDRNKIKRFDEIDSVDSVNKVTFSLNQRILKKIKSKEGVSKTTQLLRFEMLQSYDLTENDKPAGSDTRPFSDLRFDLDSRLTESLLLNIDSSLNVYDDEFKTFNVMLGLKPISGLTLMAERRYTKSSTTFLQGTVDYSFLDGWRLQYSSRYDEDRQEFQENDVSLAYENACNCWGIGIDFIKRNNINGGISQDDTRFMFRFDLKGIGSFGDKKDDKLLHRNF